MTAIGESTKSRVSTIIFTLSVLTALFWIISISVNVYRFAVVGALFEFAWLPMLLGVFALPIVSFIFLYRENFNPRSLYLYAFLISLGTLIFMLLSN